MPVIHDTLDIATVYGKRIEETRGAWTCKINVNRLS